MILNRYAEAAINFNIWYTKFQLTKIAPGFKGQIPLTNVITSLRYIGTMLTKKAKSRIPMNINFRYRIVTTEPMIKIFIETEAKLQNKRKIVYGLLANDVNLPTELHNIFKVIDIRSDILFKTSAINNGKIRNVQSIEEAFDKALFDLEKALSFIGFLHSQWTPTILKNSMIEGRFPNIKNPRWVNNKFQCDQARLVSHRRRN